MDIRELDELFRMLPEGRTVFHYFADRYATSLLGYACGDGTSVRELKRSRFSKLLRRPAIRDILAQSGGRPLRRDDFDAYWPATRQGYVLSLDRWGDDADDWEREYDQTCRPGYNLVLQLNFPRTHDRRFQDVFDESFNHVGHPADPRNRYTLAWARVDVDFDHDEALIEEIQSDWVYRAETELRFAPEDGRVRTYVEQHLQPHRRWWADAMLTAAIRFLREEIGIRRIFYHTFTSTRRLKDCFYAPPPRSLYSRLPRRFCFEEVARGPRSVEEFAAENNYVRCQLRNPALRWYRLSFDENDRLSV